MILIHEALPHIISIAVQTLCPDADPTAIPETQIQKTRKEFEGDYTINVFPLVKLFKLSPEQTAAKIGDYLISNTPELSKYNIIKGFLNISVVDSYWLTFFSNTMAVDGFGLFEQTNVAPVVIEYSSPNTNKPLHLGHVRNNLLGVALANILKASGQHVIKVNLVNDRGIHICKSMLAWQKWGNNETPESSGIKGDHLVGKYYVIFDKELKNQVAELVAGGMTEEDAKKNAPLLAEAQELLVQWEHNNTAVVDLWKMMNGWVYSGFAHTYQRMGVDFHKTYYESETYLLGKDIVTRGLQDKVLFTKDNGSVWIDLKEENLDEKLLLRADGTSVYMTQDLGTACMRQEEFKASSMIYVVGNEQNYHFDVLKVVLKKLGYAWADSIKHFSYGMIELPEGKMKSREGTVVDADDLMEEMHQTAKTMTQELGKVEGLSEEDANKLFEMIGMGALKYFILKVDPKKTMLFNPNESIDFNGNTGPFIQYTHARIRSLIRKGEAQSISLTNYKTETLTLHDERELIKFLYDLPQTIQLAAQTLSPAVIANYTYDLVKEYNHFYQSVPVLREENKDLLAFRLHVSERVAYTINTCMKLLGIDVPEKM